MAKVGYFQRRGTICIDLTEEQATGQSVDSREAGTTVNTTGEDCT